MKIKTKDSTKVKTVVKNFVNWLITTPTHIGVSYDGMVKEPG